MIYSENQPGITISTAWVNETLQLKPISQNGKKNKYTKLYIDGLPVRVFLVPKQDDEVKDSIKFNYSQYLSLTSLNNIDKSIVIGLGDDTVILKSKKIKISGSLFQLMSSSQKAISIGKPGDQLLIQSIFQDGLLAKTFVFVNDNPIGNLIKVANLPLDVKLYCFQLENLLSKKDTLSKILNPKGNLDKIDVKISIGTSIENRVLVNDHFTIVFDENKSNRIIISWILAMILILVMGYIYCEDKLAIIRNSKVVSTVPPAPGEALEKPIMEPTTFSLAKTQMAFWTLVILFAFLYVWANTGSSIQITAQVFFLLGISAGTTIFASVINQNDASNPLLADNMHQNEKSSWILPDILQDKCGYSISRLQNVAFTIAVGGYFLFEVIVFKKIPTIDPYLVVLMAISSTAYVAVKQGENKN